ncbi:ChuX/HutX family heme-like substrate-binding protein [Burkholderia sp. Ac-20365]|uniref:hemin-degrading factor n=1 Tax=Burkholderia sp. Ac-20365 TaxID=2703897 RepID=UPI00197B1433|nr:ChuX/HutX family heme-like substrate-binding protein [Burkholderia sp. Ac-20365]MBN3764034.1 hemin-degrading factor [Burkholderia sp. Ac-20365]
MQASQQRYTTDAASLDALRQDFLHIRKTQKLRQREAAAALGVSEGEALAAFVGEEVVRLDERFIELFESMPSLGSVMILTRNEAAVHEKDGPFEKMSHEGTTGLALGSAIDLRMFYGKWASAFAVSEPLEHGMRHSIQVFDAQGRAVTKIYLRKHSDHAAFEALVERHKAAVQTAGLIVAPAQPSAPATPDEQIDAEGFRHAWTAMTDTHQFFPLLRRFNVGRTQALRLAPQDYAWRVGKDSIETLLTSAAKTALPIMVFVGNGGMIQIHTGAVSTIRTMGPWLNVLDPDFNLHLRTDLIDSIWVVRKPTSDGIVTSVELYDAQGENIALLFGARKPGNPELPAWRALVDKLARDESTNAIAGACEA